ncbi:hypothetical protein [Nocardioides sp. zg-DK7169]|nr:hypothetical protein [Nocardioides sp. zg-DK7169]NPC98139.1 hypothetical protein [Nocardioides sp. zg-DK7169]
MKLLRTLAVTLAATGLSVGMLSLTAPAAQADTSWGCGGLCRVAPGGGR